MTAFDPDEAFPGLPGRPVATSVPVDFATLELLPYGVIVVDSAGVILFYNRREERISGLLRGEVMGRNFFTEVAPCTAVQAFHGRFLKLMEHGIENRLFTPMFTTKGERGTGLGLASVHAAVRRHGGTITVQSAPGRGTRFRIELPLIRD